MTTRRKTALAGLLIGALAATLAQGRPAAAEATPAPATAAPAAAPSSEAQALAAVMAHGYMSSILTDTAEQTFDLADYPIFQTAPFNTPSLAGRWKPWVEITRQATMQTYTERKPQFEQLLARTLAARLSIAELRVGAKFINGPGGPFAVRVLAHEQPTPVIPDSLKSTQGPINGQAFIATINAAMAKAHRPLPPAADAALTELKGSEAGRALLKDLLKASTWTDAKQEYFELSVPPLMIHMADGMEADQAKWDAAAKDAPSPEALALGVSIVRGGYATLDENSWAQINAFTTIIGARIPANVFGEAGLPPKWAPLMLTAMVDTVHSDQPVMEQAVGRALARLLTPDDLKTLATFMNGPAPAYFVKKAMTGLGGSKDSAPPPPEVTAAVNAFSRSGVMDRLAARMQDKNTDKLIGVGVDATIPITARFLRRFGEKAVVAAAPPATPAAGH